MINQASTYFVCVCKMNSAELTHVETSDSTGWQELFIIILICGPLKHLYSVKKIIFFP